MEIEYDLICKLPKFSCMFDQNQDVTQDYFADLLGESEFLDVWVRRFIL